MQSVLPRRSEHLVKRCPRVCNNGTDQICLNSLKNVNGCWVMLMPRLKQMTSHLFNPHGQHQPRPYGHLSIPFFGTQLSMFARRLLKFKWMRSWMHWEFKCFRFRVHDTTTIPMNQIAQRNATFHFLFNFIECEEETLRREESEAKRTLMKCFFQLHGEDE